MLRALYSAAAGMESQQLNSKAVQATDEMMQRSNNLRR